MTEYDDQILALTNRIESMERQLVAMEALVHHVHGPLGARVMVAEISETSPSTPSTFTEQVYDTTFKDFAREGQIVECPGFSLVIEQRNPDTISNIVFRTGSFECILTNPSAEYSTEAITYDVAPAYNPSVTIATGVAPTTPRPFAGNWKAATKGRGFFYSGTQFELVRAYETIEVDECAVAP